MALPATRQLVAVLGLPLVFFAVVNLAMAWLIAERGEGWRFSKLSLDGEATAPAYYNALLLLLTALLFGLSSVLARRDGDRMWWRWAVLCVASSGMSVDEAVGLHEIVGERFGRLLPDEGMPFNS